MQKVQISAREMVNGLGGCEVMDIVPIFYQMQVYTKYQYLVSLKNLYMQMALHCICIIGYRILLIKSIPLKI